MHFSDNGFVVVCLIIGFFVVYSKNEKEEEIDKYDDFSEDIYSFVVLIDIVFTDSSKKTCTGTIIHDNVVITAAHCLKILDEIHVQAELTASFVVLGTKKMFEAGYEQYLPIERVIIHPNYSVWTADLALIHTFAGMMSDKPGRIVPLANEKTNTPVLSDVIVFSWNPYKLNDATSSLTEKKENIWDKKKTDHLENNTDYDDISKVTSLLTFDSSNEAEETTRLRTVSTANTLFDNKKRLKQRRKRIKMKLKQNTMDDEEQITYNPKESSLEARSRYRHENIRYSHSNIKHFNSKTEQLSWEKQKDNFERVSIKERITQRNRYTKKPFGVMPYHKNDWRRKIGDQQNKLTAEVFGFVNTQTCKKIIEKAIPSSNEIKNFNEVLCYSSEDHFITEANSGAPAMRRGYLVAVTIAGVDFEGERVAIGIKISCFCSWISENIPKSGTSLVCCKNCCEKKEDIDYNSQYIKRKASN
ncbi:uncharacterized protein LOC116769341 isoform X2 [Danaus plexippus]|uniref:uncharacterized protein LOC116769341 isoform X2 n=1 Tax=Danaus plexippus TaxID=13037 RepID=UPI002AB01C8D|nr:uncharacterized protein LOC116769341 isoform X2 [Danaus plexippus]